MVLLLSWFVVLNGMKSIHNFQNQGLSNLHYSEMAPGSGTGVIYTILRGRLVRPGLVPLRPGGTRPDAAIRLADRPYWCAQKAPLLVMS